MTFAQKPTFLLDHARGLVSPLQTRRIVTAGAVMHCFVVALTTFGCHGDDETVRLDAPASRAVERTGLDALSRALNAEVGGFASDEWQYLSVYPTAGELLATSSAEGDLWIWEQATGVLSWDGERLRTFASVPEISDVASNGSDDVWIAARQLHHWNGKTMETVPTPDVEGFDKVWVAGGGTTYAASARGYQLLRIDDAGATVIPAPVLATDVTGTGVTDVWAWAWNLDGLWHFDGTSWSQQWDQKIALLRAFAPNDVWAVTTEDARYCLHHYDGRKWTEVTSPGDPSYIIRSIAGTSATDLWLVGSKQDPQRTEQRGVLLHYDGEHWVEVSSEHGLTSLATIPGGTVAVGQNGDILELSTTPSYGLRPLTSKRATVHAVWASSPSNVWAAGDGLLHFDGQHIVELGERAEGGWTDIWGSGPDDIWVVGARGDVLHGDGRRWQRHRLPGGLPLRAVFAKSPDEAWLASTNQLIRWTAMDGFQVATPAWLTGDMDIDDIHGVAKDDIWLAASDRLSHYDGQAWSAPISFPVDRLWASASNDVDTITVERSKWTWVTGHWDGESWTKSSGMSWGRTPVLVPYARYGRFGFIDVFALEPDIWIAAYGVLHRGTISTDEN